MNDITRFLSANSPASADDVELRKGNYIKSLNFIFDQIGSWLKDPIQNGLVTNLFRGEIQISEQQTGAYLVPEMSFTAANTTIRFIPKGLYVIGASGRIDVHSSRGARAVLVLKDAQWLYINARTGQHPALTEAVFLDVLKYMIAR